MTQTEKDMAELNLDESALEARRQALKDVTQAANGRKQRSDAGKPRESFYVTIPGVRFDMGIDSGRSAFKSWLQAALSGEETAQFVPDVIDGLLREIDRHRK